MITFGDTHREHCPICASSNVEKLWTIPFSKIAPPVKINGAMTSMAPILDVDSTVYCYSSCGSCQSIFLDPYDGTARAAYKTSRFHATEAAKHDTARLQGYQNQYDNWIKPHLPSIPKVRMLDAGCGAGEYLLCALHDRPTGFAGLMGVELSKHSVETVNSTSPNRVLLSAQQLDLDEPGSLAHLAAFDFIVLSEVFEHLEFPRVALANLARVLATGGKMFFTAQCPGGNLPIRPAEPIYTSEVGLHRLMQELGLTVLISKMEAGRWKTVVQK